MSCMSKLLLGVLVMVKSFPTYWLLTWEIDIILPGTKWCGPGNIALHYDDLGIEVELDKCCRTHDHCPEKIPAFSERYGLINIDLFQVFPCMCEKIFFNCLHSVNKSIADYVGQIYFALRNRCYNYQYPVAACTNWQGYPIIKRCFTYALNTTLPKKWQFFDLPFFA